MRRICLMFVVLYSLFLVTCHLSADVPRTMVYQGKLTDEFGVGFNGDYDLTFVIYDSVVAGDSLWAETHNAVAFAKGLFAVVLGDSEPFGLPFDEQYWLEIRIEGTTVSPRLQLTASPYALNIADTIRKSSIQVFDTDIRVCGDDIYFSEPDDAFITYYGFDEAINVNTHFAPWFNNTFDLGISFYRWRDLYLDGKIYVDGSADADMYLGTDSSGNLTYLPDGGGGADNDWAAVGGGVPDLAGDIYHTGDVGIGTISPIHKLEVVAISQVPIYATSSDAGYASIYINGTAAGANVGYGYSRSGALEAHSYLNSSNDWILKVGTHNNAIVVDESTGNVGLGTSIPDGLLDIVGTTGDGRGLYIHDASGIGDPDTGIVIRNVGHHGILIDSVGYSDANSDGIYIRKPNDRGISIIAPGDDGIYVWQSVDDGVYVTGAGDDGVYIAGTGDDGAYIYNTAGDGVEICGGAYTERGIYIHDALSIGDPDTGIVIRDVGHHGIYIDSIGYNDASSDGIYINKPNDDGIAINEPGDDGIYVCQSSDDGIYITGAGDDGLYIAGTGDDGAYIYNIHGDGIEICGGADTERGIYIHDASGIGDPDTGIVIRNVGYQGICIDSVGYSSGDFDNNGIFIRKPHSNGVGVYFPGAHGFYACEPGADGMYIYSPIDDGVAVSSPGDNCFECDGSPVSLFRVTKQCEVFSHSYNQYIVDDEGQGISTPVSASTGRWLEHIGEAQLVDGECKVNLPKDFLDGVTITEYLPMQVFLTPYGHLGDYTIERNKTHFIVHQIEGDKSARFAYKIHAKIRGYENNTTTPIDLNDYIDEEDFERE